MRGDGVVRLREGRHDGRRVLARRDSEEAGGLKCTPFGFAGGRDVGAVRCPSERVFVGDEVGLVGDPAGHVFLEQGLVSHRAFEVFMTGEFGEGVARVELIKCLDERAREITNDLLGAWNVDTWFARGSGRVTASRTTTSSTSRSRCETG